MKTKRTLHTVAEVERLKKHVDQYPKAKEITQEIVRKAEIWAALDDRFLQDLPPPATVFRGFLPSFSGCPVHGEEVFSVSGGPWSVDIFEDPWKIKCAVGGETYPSNNFPDFLRTGDRSLLTGDYADDGHGWDPGDGQPKFWFVANYCYNLWHKIIPALRDLGRAYLITGERRFGWKGAILLDKLATLFPTMDHSSQSWYGINYQKGYTGRFVYAVQESVNIGLYAEAYDDLFPILQEDTDLHEFLGKNSNELINHVEENLVRQSVRDIWEGMIRGNYGLHQAATMIALAVLDDHKFTDWAVDQLAGYTGAGPTTAVWAYGVEGWDHALDNFLFRDGVSFEVAIGYSAGCWNRCLMSTDLMLERLGKKRLPEEHIQALGSCDRRLACYGGTLPSIADTGANVRYPELDLSSLGKFFRGYGWPEYARALLDGDTIGEKCFRSYEDLFDEPLTRDELESASKDVASWPMESDNLGGVGFGVLRSGQDENQLAAIMQYGHANAGHAHRDRLGIEVISGGKRVVPDAGYPTHAAEHPDPPVWEKNTVSHMCVVVNESRQDTSDEGELVRFAKGVRVQHIEVSSPRAYLGIDTYQRGVTLVELEPDLNVMVDLFHVKGGWAHDYSFHGFEGEFFTDGVSFDTQNGGTLAGPQIAYGEIYDDPELVEHARMPGPPGTNGKRSYGSYHGSGFSYLYNVARGRLNGQFAGNWKDDEMGLRMLVPEGVAQEVITAQGKPPNKPSSPDHFDYVLLRNRGDSEADRLHSIFAVVCETFRNQPRITGVDRLSASSEDAIGIKVSWEDGICYLASNTGEGETVTFDEGLALDGGFGVLTLGKDGKARWGCVSGRLISLLKATVSGPGTWRGTVREVDFEGCSVVVEPSPGCERPPCNETLAGSNITHVWNFPVESVSEESGSYRLKLGAERLRIGRFVIDEEIEDGLSTRTWIHREWEDTEDSGCHYLIGARVAHKGRLWEIEKVYPRPDVGGHRFVFSGSIPYSGPDYGDPVIFDLGPGDDCVMRQTVYQEF